MADNDQQAAEGTPELSILGATVRTPVEHVEWFPAPPNCSTVRFRTAELSSVCPVTQQPDLSSVEIEYAPNERCIESKSLKLFLWSFRNMPIFAEALAGAIATEVHDTVVPHWVRVTLTQRPRGGIELQTVSTIGTE